MLELCLAINKRTCWWRFILLYFCPDDNWSIVGKKRWHTQHTAGNHSLYMDDKSFQKNIPFVEITLWASPPFLFYSVELRLIWFLHHFVSSCITKALSSCRWCLWAFRINKRLLRIVAAPNVLVKKIVAVASDQRNTVIPSQPDS